jgi:hypothetical protein
MKNIEPAMDELRVLLRLWADNHLDFSDKKILSNFVDREVKDRGCDSIFEAYNRVVIDGEKL